MHPEAKTKVGATDFTDKINKAVAIGTMSYADQSLAHHPHPSITSLF